MHKASFFTPKEIFGRGNKGWKPLAGEPRPREGLQKNYFLDEILADLAVDQVDDLGFGHVQLVLERGGSEGDEQLAVLEIKLLGFDRYALAHDLFPAGQYLLLGDLALDAVGFQQILDAVFQQLGIGFAGSVFGLERSEGHGARF